MKTQRGPPSEEERLLLQLVKASGAPPAVKAALKKALERGGPALSDGELQAVEAQVTKCSSRPDGDLLRSFALKERLCFSSFLMLLRAVTDNAPERQFLSRIGHEASKAAHLESELQRVGTHLGHMSGSSPAPDNKENVLRQVDAHENHAQQALNSLLFENNALRGKIDALRKEAIRLREVKAGWRGFIEEKISSTAQQIAGSKLAMEAGQKAERRLRVLIDETHKKFQTITHESNTVAASMRKQIKLHSFLKKKTREKNLLCTLEAQIAQKSELLHKHVAEKELEVNVQSAASSRKLLLDEIEQSIYKELGFKSLSELQSGFALLHEKHLSVKQFIAELRREERELDEGLSAFKQQQRKYSDALTDSLDSGQVSARSSSEKAQQLQFLEQQMGKNSELFREIEDVLTQFLGGDGASPQHFGDELAGLKALLTLMETRMVDTMLSHSGSIAEQIGPLINRSQEETQEQIWALFGMRVQESASPNSRNDHSREQP